MRPRGLETIARMLGTAAPAGCERTIATGAAFDSRRTDPGDLFFAISGEREGIDFVDAAFAAGAVAAVVGRGMAARVPGPALEVDDPRAALGTLAAAVRAEEREHLPAVAITGSVGKTTACGYTATLLECLGPVHRPPASYNNDLGVPVTILGAPEEARALVVEIGTNGPGEVARLASWTEARAVAITAIGPVHLLGLGSLDGVEREKLSLLSSVPEDAERWVPVGVGERARAMFPDVRTFGPGGDSEIRPDTTHPGREVWRLDGAERTFPWRPVLRHQRELLAAALGLGVSLGAGPEALLSRVRRLTDPPLRGEVCRAGEIDLLLDCYNANPVAVEAALERLEDEPCTGRRVCVLGTMEELGAEEEHWHREIGRRLAESRVDTIFLVGRLAPVVADAMTRAGRTAEIIAADDAGADRIAASLEDGDRVLFKASRVERLERLAERLSARIAGEVEA